MFLTSLLVRVALPLWLGLCGAAAVAEDFLAPEEAFRFEARALDPHTVELAFTVADGYYLYREQFAFKTDEEAVALGEAQIPPGKIKYDETFEKDVESHRGRLAIRLPVRDAPATFTLRVTSQGCADQGLCYPPMQSVAKVRLAGFGGDGSVVVLPDGAAIIPGLAVAALGAGSTTATADPAFSGNTGEDSGIEAALRGGSFWVVVGVFFVAGLLLSLTPCVLPMLPILSSIVMGQGAKRDSRTRGFVLALAYSLGMALVYTGLGVAAGLAGEGLAAALQNPWVLGSFAALLGVLALSMFGVYDLQLPTRVRERLAARSSRLRGGTLASVFLMGGLSALIVSPCVAAPLAGALLYISQSRDVALGGTALFSLAAGMSVPLLVLGASAGSLLPKAGPWMETVKRGFGVLLLATAWWILAPVLPAALIVAGWGLLLLSVASLLHAFDRLPQSAGTGQRFAKAGGLALAVVGVVQIVGASAGARSPLQPLQPFVQTGEPSRFFGNASSADVTRAPADDAVIFRRVASVQELDAIVRTAGRPVMLDFYADWCVSCKEMERFTFTDASVRAKLGKAVLLQADVTKNSVEDRALLKRFNLFGPPGIVFFDAEGRELPTRVIGYQNANRFIESLRAAGL
jgi:thiol:disulfide interchange protein DsbD